MRKVRPYWKIVLQFRNIFFVERSNQEKGLRDFPLLGYLYESRAVLSVVKNKITNFFELNSVLNKGSSS